MPWLTIGTSRSLIVCSGTSVTPRKSAFIPKLLSGSADHATMKFMSARSSSRFPNDLAGASVETVHEIVQRAAGKLSVLQARRTHIRKRIQALLHLSRALSEDAAISRSSRSEKVAIAIDSSRSAPLEGNVRLDRTSASGGLRRACRIALIETDDAECAEQILERIRKRNSVSLENLADPLAAIAVELNRMANEREACRYSEGEIERWQLRRS
jgi:hypothetical protein